MARTRDPARDKAKEMFLESKGNITNRDIASALGVDEKKIATWKLRDKWNVLQTENVVQQKKKRSTTNKKKVKEVAKALIEEGYSISEVAKKTEIPKGTIGRWSAEGNLQQSQLEHLKAFKEKHRERIRLNKEKRLQVNETALDAISYEINHWEDSGRISKAAMEKLLMNEEAEQKIFEVDRIERMEKTPAENTESEEKDRKFTIEVLD